MSAIWFTNGLFAGISLTGMILTAGASTLFNALFIPAVLLTIVAVCVEVSDR